jgi:integrase
MLIYGLYNRSITTIEHELSIMTNSDKVPSSKARKGTVSIRLDSGSVKACFPRTHFADEKQLKLATGIPNDANWEATANKLQRRLQLELEEGKLATADGSFNVERYREILEEYGLRAKLRVVKSVSTSDGQLPPKPELNILEVWDMYCEYKKNQLRETTYVNLYQRTFKNAITEAVASCKSEDAIEIRSWLLANKCLHNAKQILTQLDNAYQLLVRTKVCSFNPYSGLSEDIATQGAKGKTQDEIIIEDENDVVDKTKAYTWDEANSILDYIQNNPKINHWYSFVKFKFLTGCRTGEAIAFMFGDIFWDKQEIVIRRTYSPNTRKHYPLKNSRNGKELIRRFPMPMGGELWELLKSIPEGKPNEIVFRGKTGRIIYDRTFVNAWHGGNGYKGIIPTLIKQGKLTKYLPPYNTRHTFITHQVYDLGRDEKIVSKWCGHGEFVSQKHYQDTVTIAMRINPDLPDDNQLNQKSEVDLLKEQVEQMRKMIEELTNKQ